MTHWVVDEKTFGEVSTNGTLYMGECKGKTENYVLKHIIFKQYITPTELQKIAKEINMQQEVYDKTGYTTPIHQIFINDGYLLFITDKLGQTVYRYLIENGITRKNVNVINKNLNTCFDMIEKLASKYHIIHGDEHLNNFMLTEDFDENNFHPNMVKIIDFGETYIDPKTNLKIHLMKVASIITQNIEMLRYHNNQTVNISISEAIPSNIIKYVV